MTAVPEGRISLSTMARPFVGCQVMSHWSGRLSCHTKVNIWLWKVQSTYAHWYTFIWEEVKEIPVLSE